MPTKIWTPFFLTANFTRSGNVLTFTVTPSDEDTYVCYYSHVDAASSTGHSHALETRTGGWSGGSTWQMGQQPDGQELLVMKGVSVLPLWVAYSTAGNGTNLTVRKANIHPTTGAFIEWVTSGVVCNASGSAAETPRVLKCMSNTGLGPVFLATQNGGWVRVYRIDGNTITSTWNMSSVETSEPTSLYVEADGTIWLTITSNLDEGAADGVWRSTDGGANFTRRGDGHDDPYSQDFAPGFYGTAACVIVDEVRRRIWCSHGRLITIGGDGGRFVSYSDDEGVSWTDVTLFGNNFGHGGTSSLTGWPYRDGDHVSFNIDVQTGGNGQGYISAPATVTYNGGVIAGNNIEEMAFFDSPAYRVAVYLDGSSAGQVKISSDSSATWGNTEDLNGEVRRRGMSIQRETQFVALASTALTNFHISIDRGLNFATFAVPSSLRAQLVAWADGF